jgi:3-oxoacyl-[acyl-carrier-protein] synthase-3
VIDDVAIGAAAPAATACEPLRGAAITSVSMAVPETVVENAQIAAQLGVDADWIVARTGIRERRIAAAGETVVDLAELASVRALAGATLDASKLDLVIVATFTHERLMPSASALLAERIGATGAGAIDLNAACTGFVAALAIAAGQVESGRAESVLVVGADVLSRVTDPDDRQTAALFADGAGAVVVAACAPPGRIGPFELGSDGANAELVTSERDAPQIRMSGHDTFREAVDRLCEATLGACEAAGTTVGEIDVFAYHQANARILEAVGERLSLDRARVVNCIDRFANTSAATVPMVLSTAARAGTLRDGSKVVVAAFGAGLTWGATVVEWGRGER